MKISGSDIRTLASLLCPERLTRIVDIGANPINLAPYDGLIFQKVASVWGFEPQQDAYEALKRRKSEHQKFLPCAVGDGETCELR